MACCVANACSGFPDDVVWTETQGFTVRLQNGSTVTTQPGIVSDRVVPLTGTYNDAWTFTYTGNGPNPAISAVAAFR